MKRTHARSVGAALAVVLLTCACTPRRVAPPSPPNQELIVLAADPDSGDVGRVIVSNGSGMVELAAAREATRVSAGQPPAAVSVLEPADIQRLFGNALSGLPPAPQQFTLNFQFGSEELTEASRALFPEILRIVAQRPAPDVIAIGHTDTTGSAATNYELGLRRATSVRDLLVAAGLDRASIEVTSHGESDLLVPTADDSNEPRNRRVEIHVQ